MFDVHQRAGKKRNRDEDRDISEKIALGQAKPTSQEGLFDSRLFNQSAGMDSGFGGGDDERYDVYDKPLFVDRSKSHLYRIDRERMEQSVGSADRMPAFAGANEAQQRTAPVEFEKVRLIPLSQIIVQLSQIIFLLSQIIVLFCCPKFNQLKLFGCHDMFLKSLRFAFIFQYIPFQDVEDPFGLESLMEASKKQRRT